MSDWIRLSTQPASGESPADPAPRRKWGRLLFGFALALVLALAGVSAALVKTGRGHRVVLNQMLGRISESLAGDLVVDGIRSGNLLTHATLTGLRLDAEGGRPFLRADSVQLRFSLLDVFDRELRRIVSVTVWGLDLEISQYPSQQFTNLQGVIQTRVDPVMAEGSDAKEPLALLRVDHLEVRGGTVQLLIPAGNDNTYASVPSPDGQGRLRRFAFEQIDLELEDGVLDSSDPAQIFVGRLSSLSTDAFVLVEPVSVAEASGEIVVGSAGIAVSELRLRLPGSALRGEMSAGPSEPDGPWSLTATLSTEGDGELEDLRWLDDRIPSGSFRGSVRISVAESTEVVLQDVDIDLEASSIAVAGRVVFGEQISFDAIDVTTNPLALYRLEPWLGRDLPLDGWLSGQVRLSGTLTDVVSSGRMTFVPTGYGGAQTTADFSGTLHGGPNPGATTFVARLEPLNYQLLGIIAPNSPLDGTGWLAFEVSGRADDGLRFLADVSHEGDSLRLSGSLTRTEAGPWTADVDADLAPLSLRILGRLQPDLQLVGEVTGSVRGVGRLRDLQLSAEFDAGGGTVTLDGVADMRRLGSFYRFDVSFESVPLDQFSARLPPRSVWNGSLSVEGRGVRLDSMDAAATLFVSRSRIGGLHVDTVTAHLRASAGILTVDSIDAVLGGVVVAGNGRLGMAAPLDGEARLTFSTDSLGGLRPLLLGDTVIAKDTLSAMESGRLTFEGVDVASLPDTADVRMHGSVDGTIRLVGSVDALNIQLDMDVRGAVYGHNRVDSASVHLTADELPDFSGDWDVLLDAFGVQYQGRSFERAHLDADMTRRQGRAVLEIERGLGERIDTRGQFAFDSLGGSVRLEEATATLDSLVYSLAHPSRVSWDQRSVSIEGLEIRRDDHDHMRITADGTLSRSDVSDFDLDIEGLHLERVARVVEFDDVAVSGHLDLTLSVEGPAANPVIEGHFELEDPSLADVLLTRVEGELAYRAKEADASLEAWQGDRQVLSAIGSVPIDLSLAEVQRRQVARPMDLRLVADSLDAAVALAYFGTLEDVVGTVSGQVRVGGTSESPEPDGIVELSAAGWSIDVLGVRHEDVEGTVTLKPDRTAELDLSLSATGRAVVTGTVTLDSISDPGLDLQFELDGFQTVQRTDIESRVSGALTLTGRYARPFVQGELTVDEAAIFVDEFVRNAGIVDLSNLGLFDADTLVFLTQPLVRDLPFLDYLRAEVTLAVPRATWLRSSDMDVEIGGELQVRYSRRDRDLVMIGELQALRGSYSVMGRRFQVAGGTVGFSGTPGMNPTLDIQAVSRIRRIDGDPLEINANVGGTLTVPRVTLSTEEAGLVQSDLVSYLVFGRSSAELATGQTAFLEGAAGSVVTLFSGAVASQIGAALAQGIGVDYLSITQAGDFAFATGLTSSLANTQVEIGQYVGPNTFIVIVFRPLFGQAAGGSFLGGARIEWALSDDYTVEGFFEDRFLRGGGGGFARFGVPPPKVVGVFIFREWGR
ncbi:MAG: translocation/assembly module TamB domain-containing protein [Gemmatimonadota bacterium]|nr:translocation/assembly module TamB domain-containing protein [Gemmatimonadota bacterium]